jgi:hypothetical protein
MTKRLCAAAVGAWMLGAGLACGAAAPESKRLGHAKDYIADQQWARAIVELQAVADDPKETNRDEALFWLAHSEHQTGDDAAAIQTIGRLEKYYPRSRWVRIAGSMRVEIAQRQRRDDLLWMMVTPPPRAVAASPLIAVPPAQPVPIPPPPSGAPPRIPATTPVPPPAGRPPRTPAAVPVQPTPGPDAGATPVTVPPVPPRYRAGRDPFPAVPSEFWPTGPAFIYDTNVRIEALGSLIESHADRAIPLLKDIALDDKSPDEARRAVWVLAQSSRSDARNTVFEVARRGTEPVKIAAIREIGHFDGPTVSTELMQVYSTAVTPRVKRQVVSSLGERADRTALYRIARIESDLNVRNSAIVTLGRTGARDQLRTLYAQAPRDSRVAVLMALCSAKDEDELIRIAQTEREPLLRARARQQLRMLATPKAIKFLNDHP